MFLGGVKSNVLPSDAKAVVNHRIHPADTIQGVIAQDVRSTYFKSKNMLLRLTIDIFFQIFLLKIENIDDERVKVSLMDGFGASEATFTSSYDSDLLKGLNNKHAVHSNTDSQMHLE